MGKDRITTALYHCGPYTFRSTLPSIGLSSDKPSWTATAHGRQVPGAFDSLEDVMRAALTGEPG